MKRGFPFAVVGLALGAIPVTTAGVADEREAVRHLSATMQRALDRSHAGLQEVRLPDGSAHIHLDGRFMCAIAVRVEPGGTVVKTCVASREEAERFLYAPKGVEPEAER
jgi:hypothetical protein